MIARVGCTEVADRAPLFVLGALEDREAAEVRQHLASCERPHPEFAELGGVVPYLAQVAEPVDGGPALRTRVLGAVAREAVAPPAPAPVRSQQVASAAVGVPSGRRGGDARDVRTRSLGGSRWWSPANWQRLALPAAAALVIAVLGAWNVTLQQGATDAEQRADQLTRAIAVSTRPDATVARLQGSVGGTTASGLAAFAPDGEGYIVVQGLPAPPPGRTYQAWYLTGAGEARSAGLLRVGSDPVVVLVAQRLPEAEAVALTIEREGGVDQPTAAPVIQGSFEVSGATGRDSRGERGRAAA